MDEHKHTILERVGDWVAVGAVVGTLTDMLPAIAALFTIVWTGIRIWETDTIQGWRGHRKRRKQSDPNRS